MSAPPNPLTFMQAREQALAAFDRDYIEAALLEHHSNVAQTARSMGLHRQSLQKIMKRLKITRFPVVGG